jgi:hypothetical protein
MANAKEIRKQLDLHRRKVDFDEYNLSVDQLTQMLDKQLIDAAPDYQRHFRWDGPRQSKLIESVFLGIPVPPIYMATNENQRWEVVDGLQRLMTIAHFCAPAHLWERLSREARARGAELSTEPLVLVELKKLSLLNDMGIDEMPEEFKVAFGLRPVKIVVLNDKSDRRVRFDLFERLNTGGLKLSDQEMRSCVFRGPFIDMLKSLSMSADFRRVVVLPKTREADGTYEEYVLRFFAFLLSYETFDHSVKGFLDDFVAEHAEDALSNELQDVFSNTFKSLARKLPYGIRGRKGTTPVNLFEGVAVGAGLVIRDGGGLKGDPTAWLESSELRGYVTGATNSRPRVRGRIEFCRDRFRKA